MADNLRIRLFWKIAVYYGFFLALVIYTWLAHPGWMQFLPFGGLDVLHSTGLPADSGAMIDQLLTTDKPIVIFEDSINLVSALMGCIVVMIPIRWLYMTDGLKESWNENVATSLLVLPLIVTCIVYIVKFSLPLAFALAGIFAGVRYRTSLKSQTDAYFTFACIAVGLSAGTRALGIGLIMAMVFAFIFLAAPPRKSTPEVE